MGADQDNQSDQESNGFVKIEHQQQMIEEEGLIEEEEEEKPVVQEEENIPEPTAPSEPHITKEDGPAAEVTVVEEVHETPATKEEREKEEEEKEEEKEKDEEEDEKKEKVDEEKDTTENIPTAGEHEQQQESEAEPQQQGVQVPELRKSCYTTEELVPRDEDHWSNTIYKVNIQLKENHWELEEEEFQAVPQWGFMKGLLEQPYVPAVKEDSISKKLYMRYVLITLFTTFTMVTMNALSKYAQRYASHPTQLALFKNLFMFLVAIMQRPSLSKLSELGMSKWSFVKRGLLMGGLGLSQQFVTRALPLSVTATIHALSPVFNSVMASIYLDEIINPPYDVPILMTACIGTLITSKPPFITGAELASNFTNVQYLAIGLALLMVVTRSNLMIFGRELRKQGAKVEHFKCLICFDTFCQCLFTLINIVVNKHTHKVFTAPDWRLAAVIVFIAALSQLRPYLITHGSSNLDVSIASVLGTSNVLFSILYSMYLFQDNSVDKFYTYGTGLVVASCIVKVNLPKEEDKPVSKTKKKPKKKKKTE